MARTNSGDDDSPLDEAAFQTTLTFLLGEAYTDGVTVDGSWSCTTDESLPNWEVEVSEHS